MDGYERYFFENVRHGIRTPEDLNIWRRIAERSPEWLKEPGYAEVVSLLKSEAAHGCPPSFSGRGYATH